MTYRVIATIQSPDLDHNDPVDVQWYAGDSLAVAVAAMAQAATRYEEDSVPVAIRPRTLSVRLDMEQN